MFDGIQFGLFRCNKMMKRTSCYTTVEVSLLRMPNPHSQSQNTNYFHQLLSLLIFDPFCLSACLHLDMSISVLCSTSCNAAANSHRQFRVLSRILLFEIGQLEKKFITQTFIFHFVKFVGLSAI